MTNNPDPEDQDTGSVTSMSTDWEHEFDIRAMPPVESSSPVCPLTLFPYYKHLRYFSELTAVESYISDEHWYAVLVGRNPGIYSGP
jgi:hypothetical protein